MAGIDTAEAVHRPKTAPTPDDTIDDPLQHPEQVRPGQKQADPGVTSPPGGRGTTQPREHTPHIPDPPTRSSTRTLRHGPHTHPGSSNQDGTTRHEHAKSRDLHPDGGPHKNSTPQKAPAPYPRQHTTAALTYTCTEPHPAGIP